MICQSQHTWEIVQLRNTTTNKIWDLQQPALHTMRLYTTVSALVALSMTHDQVLARATAKDFPENSIFFQPEVDESAWAKESIPAENNPAVAKFLEEASVPEPWDHL